MRKCRMVLTQVGLTLIIASLGVSCSGDSKKDAEIRLATGTYRAELATPGGPLPFHLEIRKSSNGFAATIRNGAERVVVPQVKRVGDEITFAFPHYDSKIVATIAEGGRSLSGTFAKTKKLGAVQTLPFKATSKTGPRFNEVLKSPPDAKTLQKIKKRYGVKFSKSKDKAIGIFDVRAGGVASGTFLTTTGDYRFLAGNLVGDTLHLSVFDGAHAFLFKLRPAGDTLVGDFWSGDSWHETLLATADDNARLPDAFSLTQVDVDATLADIPLTDIDAKKTTLLTVAPLGPRIIELFGTWCPNCHDAAGILDDLHRSLSSDGLQVVGLAFEYSGDVTRDLAQIKRYRERHDVGYPTLLAGVADKDVAGKLFPGLDRVRAFPTTLFVDHTGKLIAVHTGFSGPASPDEYAATKAAFTRRAQRLVAAYDVAQRSASETVDAGGTIETQETSSTKSAKKVSKARRAALKAKAKRAAKRRKHRR